MTRSRIILVACVLAIAVAGCKRNQKSEAEQNLARLETVLKTKLEKVGGFPSGRVGPTPAAECCAQPDKACNDPGAWQLPLWTELGFSIPGKHRFMYSYEGSPTQFTLTATGDLDCDGTPVVFKLTGTAEGKKLVSTWQKPTTLD
jgi:hypothetical protein